MEDAFPIFRYFDVLTYFKARVSKLCGEKLAPSPIDALPLDLINLASHPTNFYKRPLFSNLSFHDSRVLDPATYDLKSHNGLARELRVLLNSIAYGHDVMTTLIDLESGDHNLSEDVKSALLVCITVLC